MSHASLKPDLSRIGERALTEVLSTLLKLPASPQPFAAQQLQSQAPDQLAATVLLSGNGLSGSVHVQLPPAFVARAVKHLTGLDGPEQEAMLEDTAGEIANMVAGRVAANLAAQGYPCGLSTPSVFRVATAPVETRPGINQGRSDLVCDGHRLSVEIQCCHPNH